MENPFTEIQSQLAAINGKLDKALAEKQVKADELLTAQEFAKTVKRSMPTIWRWETEGRITPIIIAGQKYYKNPLLRKDK